MAIPKDAAVLTVPFDRSILGKLREATIAAETGLYRIEELEATLKSADSFVEGWKAEAEQLRAENQRLREAIELAPHGDDCSAWIHDSNGGRTMSNIMEARHCDCWKKQALEETDEN